MRILVTYYTRTGNTKKVAESIHEALTDHDVDIVPIDKIDISAINLYELIFLGSGVYASRVDKSLLRALKNAEHLNTKFALFCTHASLELYQKPFAKVEKLIESKGGKIINEFDCIGDNIGIPKEKQLEMLNALPQDQRKKAEEDMKKIKNRPNAEDLKKAMDFAKETLNKMR
ncbi:MAG: flavodoxin family protein [Promethearchaeia archaeon]